MSSGLAALLTCTLSWILLTSRLSGWGIILLSFDCLLMHDVTDDVFLMIDVVPLSGGCQADVASSVHTVAIVSDGLILLISWL